MQISHKQPKGLYLLFFTEAWERFGFYTLQTIVMLYMSKVLLFNDDLSFELYAVFSALLYLTPMFGGYLADKYLGYKQCVNLGGLCFIAGYCVLAINTIPCFFLGLALIITANGLFKPNVSSLLGTLYQENDPRRQGGFTLFYMGINLGSLIPPLIAGAVVQHWGWHMGFLLAAIGMFFGLLTFLFGKKVLKQHVKITRAPFKFTQKLVLYLILILATGLFYGAFYYPAIINLILEFAGIIVFAVIVYLCFQQHGQARHKLLASVILIILSIGFWALYNQTFMTLMLYADRNMDKSWLGFTMTPEFTQFYNPFFIVLFSPLLNYVWTRLAVNKKDISIAMKFAIGIFFMALGFIVLAMGGKFFAHQGIVSAWWLVGSYFLQTVGELFLSPIGLSMVTELSPPKMVGMMMGVWFFATAEASEFAGILAKYASVPEGSSTVSSLAIYNHAFLIYGLITLVLAAIAFSLVPFLKKMVS